MPGMWGIDTVQVQRIIARMRALALLCLLLLAGCDPIAKWRGETNPAALARAAAREGRVVIWSTTDRPAVAALLADFHALHPDVAINYRDMPGQPMHRLLDARARGGGAMPDLVWSSAMDLQIKLVNDGHALRYASPERAALPDWANWKNEAWGVTAEPIVIVSNRRLLPAAMVPRSHADLLQLLERRPAVVRGRVATYDIARSAVGFLYLSQDVAASRSAWPLVRALGRNGVRLFPTSEGVISDVSAGRSVIGYNVAGSYAVAGGRRHRDLAVVLPRDYTLLMSRIAVIPARAAHPQAAKIFLDYLLSRRGQEHLTRSAMPSVRRDLAVPASLGTPEASRRAIRVGPSLLVVQDQLTRRRFLSEWRRLTDPVSE